MSFKVKRWGSLGQIRVTDYDAGAQAGAGTDQSWVFSFGGRIVFLCYNGSYSPSIYTFDPATESWAGPTNASAIGPQWSWHSYTYGDDAEYQVWGNQYIVGYGMPISNWTASSKFCTIDANMNFTRHTAPAAPSGGGIYDQAVAYHAGVGVDPAGLPARLCTWVYKKGYGDLYVQIFRYGPGGTAQLLGETAYADVAWTVDPVDHQPYFSGAAAGGLVFWPVDNGCPDATIEDKVNLFSSVPLDGTQCSPLAPIAPLVRTFAALSDVTWQLVTDRTAGNPGVVRWAPVSQDASSSASPPWSSAWSYRQLRDGIDFGLDQGDVDGVDHGAEIPPMGDVSYNAALGWYLGANATGKAGVSTTAYVLDPQQPTPLERRPAKLGTSAIGWIGECAIRPNLRVENVLPAGRASPQGLGGSVVERKSGKYLLTPAAIVKRSGGVLTVGSALSVDVSSYPVTSPDWTWQGSEDGRVETMGWSSFAEGPNATMLWCGMPDYMWGMYFYTGAAWIKRWSGLGVLHNENLEAAAGLPTHKLENSGLVTATMSDIPPLPDNYENAPAQLIGWPDFPGGPVVAYFGSATQQSAPPYWRAIIWRVLNGVWTEIVDFKNIAPPGLGELDWTVWSIAPIRQCAALPLGGFLVGATLYFTDWIDYEQVNAPTTFLDTGKGYVPGKPGYEGPLEVENAPKRYVCEPYSGGRSMYGPDALLVYDHQGNFVTHLNTEDVYPPDGRQILVTRESVPRVIYKTYWQGTYSDYAEGWGAYHAFDEDAETQTGLYVCYDLMNDERLIAPGMGRCHGFLDMYSLGAGQDSTWRWSRPNTWAGYEGLTHPNLWWGPPGRSQVRAGLGGRSITLLGSRNPSSRQGTKGVGQRA